MISACSGVSAATQRRITVPVSFWPSSASGEAAGSTTFMAISQSIDSVDRRLAAGGALWAVVGGGERLVAGDAEQPGRHRRAALVAAGVLPGVDEDFADHVVGQRGVAHDAQRETIDPHLVAREQGAHGELVAVGDLLDQDFVG